MLILTRRIGESLIIEDKNKIVMTVLGVKGNQVRIGVNAPIDVAVHREEIYNRIKNKQNTQDNDGYVSKTHYQEQRQHNSKNHPDRLSESEYDPDDDA